MTMEPVLKLRAPEPSDVDMLYRLEGMPEVKSVSWGEAPVSRQMLWEYVQTYSADAYRDRQLRLIAELNGEAVGTVDISDFDPSNRRAMAGIAIEERWRRQGIGAKALEALVEYCREALGLHQLAAIVPKSNEASLALFKKAGFSATGCLRSWLRRGNEYEDAIVLQLIIG